MRKIKTYYKRKLPHIHPIGATFFITVLVKDAIPDSFKRSLKNIIELDLQENDSINQWKRRFKAIDDFLDGKSDKSHLLKSKEAAEIVKKQLHRFDGKWYNLLAYSIMSNHFHVVFETSIQLLENGEPSENYVQVNEIMRRIKGASGRYLNELLNLEGQFWEKESYDHFARSDEELQRIISYTIQNPVKAGLVENWDNHPHTYLKP